MAVRNSLLEKFSANLDAAGKFFTDFPAAPNAIPAKFSAFSGKENGCFAELQKLAEMQNHL